MENSSKVISSVAGAIVFLYIIMLILAALMNKKTFIWPPWVSECPDYWITSKDSKGQIRCTKNPLNKNGLDKMCPPLLDRYETDGSLNMDGVSDIDKCSWARECKVTWDNINNKC